MSSYRPSSMYSSMFLQAGKINILNLQITQLKSRKIIWTKHTFMTLEVPCCPPRHIPWKLMVGTIHPWSPQEADVDGEAPEAPPAEAPDAKRLAAAAAAARRRGNPTKKLDGWEGWGWYRWGWLLYQKYLLFSCGHLFFLRTNFKNNRCKSNKKVTEVLKHH